MTSLLLIFTNANSNKAAQRIVQIIEKLLK